MAADVITRLLLDGIYPHVGIGIWDPLWEFEIHFEILPQYSLIDKQ